MGPHCKKDTLKRNIVFFSFQLFSTFFVCFRFVSLAYLLTCLLICSLACLLAGLLDCLRVRVGFQSKVSLKRCFFLNPIGLAFRGI